MEKKKLIELKGIHKEYNGNVVIDDLNLYINENEFITLVGPSGCGKTTTLRIIGGFETPDYGQVILDGITINNTPPYHRPINTVFQKYALFPHLNVFDNVAFGLRNFSRTMSDLKNQVALRYEKERRELALCLQNKSLTASEKKGNQTATGCHQTLGQTRNRFRKGKTDCGESKTSRRKICDYDR